MAYDVTTAHQAEQQIRAALTLIKKHITVDETEQNRDLHQAVGMIVRACRANGVFDTEVQYCKTCGKPSWACPHNSL